MTLIVPSIVFSDFSSTRNAGSLAGPPISASYKNTSRAAVSTMGWNANQKAGQSTVMNLVAFGERAAPAPARHCSYSRRLPSRQSLAPSPFAKCGEQFLGAPGIQVEKTARATKKIVGTGDQREFLAGDL